MPNNMLFRLLFTDKVKQMYKNDVDSLFEISSEIQFLSRNLNDLKNLFGLHIGIIITYG